MKNRAFLLCALALATAWIPAEAAHKYIAATGPFGTGDSPSTPLNASGTNFAAVMNSMPTGTTIHIAAGVYNCNDTVFPLTGWSVIGAGIDQTVIVRTNVSSGGTGSVFYNAQNDSILYFSDMTIDLSGHGGMATIPAVCSMNAILVNCLTGIIERVKVIDPKQTITDGAVPTPHVLQGFPFSLTNATSQDAYARIADCEVVINNSGSAMSAISIAGIAQGSFSGEMINNKVINNGDTTSVINAFGTGAIHDFIIHGNTSISANDGVDLLAWTHKNVAIVGNTFLDCRWTGIAVGGGGTDPSSNPQSWNGLIVRDNIITTRSRGIFFQGNVSDSVIANNMISSAAGYTATNGIQLTNSYGANERNIVTGNQISAGLSNDVPATTTSFGFENIPQPASLPISIDVNSMTLSSSGAAKLVSKSTGSSTAQLWLTSDDNSMVWSKANDAANNELRLEYYPLGGSGGTLATFTTNGTFTAGNLKYGSGTPESVVSANRGTLYSNSAGGAGTSLYVQENSGPGGTATNTGWKKVLSGSSSFPSTTMNYVGGRVSSTGSLDLGTIGVTSAAVGDTVALGLPSTVPDDVIFSGYVSSAGNVTIRVYNPKAVGRDIPAGFYKAMIIK